ncbi:jg15360 [Pararge aegeria aegeria]|uniref:Jg15360 protein n=1 Tax=Pararge aegeria aegeria TaxID=348720 RepID=A0A8S4QS62_9NEOP|nr:jg15360 [Pararge aegeria aegeria]
MNERTTTDLETDNLTKYRNEVLELIRLCNLSRMPEKIGEFIEQSTSLAHGDLLKYEASSLYSRDQITVAKGQNLKLGTVVAKKTEDGFIRVLNPTGTDGTQTAIGAILSDVNATENAKAVIITRGAILADHAVVWPANITEEQKAEAIKQLEARGIIIRKGV